MSNKRKRPVPVVVGTPDMDWARARHEAQRAKRKGEPMTREALAARVQQLKDFRCPPPKAPKMSPAEKQGRFFANTKLKYGLGKQEYLHLLVSQGSACKACGVELVLFSENRKQAPVVDHCHETGKVRGLLCTGCNNRVGRVEFLAAAERYEVAKRYLSGA